MPTDTRPLGQAQAAAQIDPNIDEVPWILEGLLAGVIGAATVALFFLLVDFADGRALWTPFALGAAFFRGALPVEGAAIDAALVAAYSVLHGTVFISVGLPAAYVIMTTGWIPGATETRRTVVLAVLLFAALSAIFLGFAALGAPGVTARFGVGRIVLANLLAAIAMAFSLDVHARRRGLAEQRSA